MLRTFRTQLYYSTIFILKRKTKKHVCILGNSMSTCLRNMFTYITHQTDKCSELLQGHFAIITNPLVLFAKIAQIQYCDKGM